MADSITYFSHPQRMVELKFAHAEMAHWQCLQRSIHEQDLAEQLERVTGITDPALLERLRVAGFDGSNVYALTWLPIAMVAWASDGVSADEVSAARLVNLYAMFTGNADSTGLFRAWLRERPSEQLVKLWEDAIKWQTDHLRDSHPAQTGPAVLYIAHKVAQASGGLLGFGQVSAAEQRVLERIRNVYGLHENREASLP